MEEQRRTSVIRDLTSLERGLPSSSCFSKCVVLIFPKALSLCLVLFGRIELQWR